VDVEIREKDAKAVLTVRPVRGQYSPFETKLEERRAPRTFRAQEQTMENV
jgi:hypothetical protein